MQFQFTFFSGKEKSSNNWPLLQFSWIRHILQPEFAHEVVTIHLRGLRVRADKTGSDIAALQLQWIYYQIESVHSYNFITAMLQIFLTFFHEQWLNLPSKLQHVAVFKRGLFLFVADLFSGLLSDRRLVSCRDGEQ